MCSAFVVKTNKIFTDKVLHIVLVIKHDNMPAEYWTAMHDKTYKLSKWQSCVDFITLTTDNVIIHTENHMSQFEDSFGIIGTKDIQMPHVFYMLCE